jgi:hypothetical protein
MICVNNTEKYLMQKTIFAFAVVLLLSCGTDTTKPQDPLQYSRKLIVEGHASLYDNGAFQVPQTEIKLIPAGKDPLALASEMMGMRARQAFLTSVNNAADSIYLIPEGTKLSIATASAIKQGGEQAGSTVTDVSRPVGTRIVKRSVNFGKDITLQAWRFGKQTASEMNRYGIATQTASVSGGGQVANVATDVGASIIDTSWQLSTDISADSNTAAKNSLLYAGDKFIKGYVAVPEKLSARGSNIAEASSLANFTDGVVETNTSRAEYSAIMTDLISTTASDFPSDVKQSLGKANDEFNESVGMTGFGLALVKSSRWVLQGVLWDGLVKPISKIGAASVGYVGVNLLAYPAMVVVSEGVAVTTLAVEVSWNTAAASYELIAPSATAALASVYSLLQFTGGNLAAGATAAGGATLGAGTIVTGEVVGNTTKGVGYVAGLGVQYIGVPLAAAGVMLGTGTVGVVAGGVGTVTGSTVIVGGEAVSVTSQVFGNVVAGATVVTGTSASVVAGTTVGVYELSKAVVVPAGYELGGGIVLGYGTISQLGAQSVLAVADASYLVLSLEGPRWVVYAVKGNLGNGDELPQGAMLDLGNMQHEGEEFYYLPVSDAEMQSVVNELYKELPQAAATRPTPEETR